MTTPTPSERRQPLLWEYFRGHHIRPGLYGEARGVGILSRHEAGVHTSLREQLRMRALLHHTALVQHDDQVSVAYGGEPMRYQQRGTPEP